MRLEPNMPRLRARLALVFAATGKHQRALQLYLRELRDDPGNIDTLLEYGTLLHDIGRVAEAGEKFRRVLEMEPANPDAHFRLGLIALATHRYEQATLEFELVLKLDAQFPGIRCAIGESLYRRGQIEEAARYLREEFAVMKGAVVAGQGHQAAIVHLASLLMEVNEPGRAAELLGAVVSSGESADVLRQLALARFRSGDHAGGAAASRRVLRIDRTCVRSMHNLALSAMQHGRLHVAAEWIRRGLNAGAHDEGLRRLRIRLWMEFAKSWSGRVLAHARDRVWSIGLLAIRFFKNMSDAISR
jgi:Flp pilus assembly protein TadD